MRLFVDLNSGSVTPQDGAVFSAKKGDRFSVYVSFVENGVVKELGNSARGRLVLKKQSDFSGYPVVWSPEWRKFGRGAGAYYLFKLDFNTQQLEDQFLTLSGELASVTLAFEIQWEHRGMRRSSRSVSFVVENDYVRLEDAEGPPEPIVDPLPPL